MGIKTSFYKVAMRPGRPLMAGRSKRFIFVGLPGNPVSSMICSYVFLNPMIHKMLGLSYKKSEGFQAKLEHPLEKNGPRQHYMRALVNDGKVTVQKNQDSASTSILQSSNALVIRPPNHKALSINDLVDVILL
jgi:molybdopterin molybdotransferase